jgi:hypothetical protein
MSHEQAKHDPHFLLSIIIAYIAFSVFLLLTACGRGEIEPTPTPTIQALNETPLTFETLEQKDWAGTGQGYEAVEPGLMIISGETDIDKLDELVTNEAKSKLRNLDYENSFALIVFLGERGRGGYDIQIERLARSGKTINIYVQFHEPEPDKGYVDMMTSPYHLVQVQKSGAWDQEFLFQLIVDNTIVASFQTGDSQLFSLAYPPPPTSPPTPYPPPGEGGEPMTTPQSTPSEAANLALEYITLRNNLSMETLVITADRTIHYPSLGGAYQVLTILDTSPGGEVYKLLVDLSNGQIIEDISAVRDAEKQAYLSKYGKLELILYERLQTLSDTDTLSVAIWITAQPGYSLEDLQAAAYAALADKYPEAKAAMKLSGLPMDVDDPELADQIEAEYYAMIEAAMEARVRPLLEELEQRGFNVTTYPGMPSITVVLPKSVIIELSNRDEVSFIYLIEGEPHNLLDMAVPNTLAQNVWVEGKTGNGV